MAGRYLDPDPYVPPHECVRPNARDEEVGNRWQCNCGQIWRAEPLHAYGKNGQPHWVKWPRIDKQ